MRACLHGWFFCDTGMRNRRQRSEGWEEHSRHTASSLGSLGRALGRGKGGEKDGSGKALAVRVWGRQGVDLGHASRELLWVACCL